MSTAVVVASAAYPVTVAIELPHEPRNRLTVFLRPILAVPHVVLVGFLGPPGPSRLFDAPGLIGAAAYVLAIVNWFAILITGVPLEGIRDFQRYYLRWRTRALAYTALLADPYPPFGDAAYPASISIVEPVARDRVTVAARLLLLLPHLVLLFFLVIGWGLATLVAWFAILVTGSYPALLQPFALGVMRWLLRVEAYALLLVDQFPPFAFE